MLILTRRVGQTLMIGDDVSVTILEVTGNQVRIGIDAPDNVAINREEIYKRMIRESGQNVSQAGKSLNVSVRPSRSFRRA